jgi:hypothetical protein
VYKKYKELMCIDPKHMKQVSEKYKLIHYEYSGCTKEMATTIAALKIEIAGMKKDADTMRERHQWELRDKDRIIEQRDLVITNKEMGNEILRLQLQLAKK